MKRSRFGYRRLHVPLKREGHVVNHSRLFRLHREEKLAMRRRDGSNAKCRVRQRSVPSIRLKALAGRDVRALDSALLAHSISQTHRAVFFCS